MGIFDAITQPANLEILWKTKGDLIKNLEKASSYLEYMEIGMDERHKIGKYKGVIDETVKVLKLPDTAYSNVKSALKVARAVSELNKISYIHQQPERAAIAFGRLFAGIGELSHYLPPPINGYFEIFAEAEHFFTSLRAKMQPEVHFKQWPTIMDDI